MGDGGGEAGSQLLVRGQLAGLREVQQRLLVPVDLVGDRERHASRVGSVRVLGERRPLLDPLERLAGAAAGREHAPVGPEHEHEFAAFLDEATPALGREAERRQVVRVGMPTGHGLHTVRWDAPGVDR